jgi:phosphoribosylformylglycinamidine synthase
MSQASTLHRIEVGLKPHVPDVAGKKAAAGIKQSLGLDVDALRIVKTYTVAGVDDTGIDELLKAGAFHDEIIQEASPTAPQFDADWIIEVGFRPGVTDNEGRTAKESACLVLGLKDEAEKSVAVYTSSQFAFSAPGLERGDMERIGRDFLANELIQRFEIKSREEWMAEPGFPAKAAKVSGAASDEVALIDLKAMDDDALMAFSKANTLALSLEEMKAIREYFADAEVKKKRAAVGLGDTPTDAEIEALAQTWSEHCKHKIFNARITYENKETGAKSVVEGLYPSYIKQTTKTLRERMGEDDFCLSVFKDNAGVISFTDEHNICIKVETHNSPSALDPYGGALTGIVGVNRDPMGTGMGSELICNTNVFCFASPFHEGELPPRLLHPRRVLEGVREGVEHGGNKSGVPTVNGSIVFHENYLGKPLVYCGTVGLMPKETPVGVGHEKFVQPGDAVVMCGGRIGKDGIHGATFSSEELHEDSPATAVQIGDPITQRKMYDFLMRARDLGLYSAITDNGAGGLSSSVGETAQFTGGCKIDLAKAPLKYDGLKPWEILLSEAQERMSLAVPREKLSEFMELAEEMDVEAVDLGDFTDTGYFHVTYGDKPVAYMDMDFFHDGTPLMELSAVWEKPVIEDPYMPFHTADQGGLLKRMLGRLNICSKEYVVRQYDHEVQGGSVVKPLTGAKDDGPADAGALRPVLGSKKGIVVSHGICPKFSAYDSYWMTASAVDEAVRNAVAVGANPKHMAACDNFCWCDPVLSDKTPDGEYKLAQLVRSNEALAHYCLAYGVPLVSGKDSMKNDYTGGGVKISIPPTLLISVVGVVDDVDTCVTSDFKKPGDLIFLLGLTKPELLGSELSSLIRSPFTGLPQVDAVSARERYHVLHDAMKAGLVTACHDLSDGGLGVALAEMCIGGRIGAKVDLAEVPVSPGEMAAADILYSESNSRLLVSVDPRDRMAFEGIFHGQIYRQIGTVSGDTVLSIRHGDAFVLSEDVADLTAAWQEPLRNF